LLYPSVNRLHGSKPLYTGGLGRQLLPADLAAGWNVTG
jgi:hypothetical protein